MSEMARLVRIAHANSNKSASPNRVPWPFCAGLAGVGLLVGGLGVMLLAGGETARLPAPKTLSVENVKVGGGVESIQVSPDGQTLALTTFCAPLELWERQTGRRLLTLRPGGFDNDVLSVAFSPDGNTLAAAGYDKTVTLWDVKTGALRRTLVGHTETVNVVALAPNGHTVASGANDKIVRLWDARTGRLLRALPPLPYQVHGLAFSPNSETVSASDRAGNVRRWSVPAGQPLGDIAASPANDVSARGMFYPVAFSPDGAQAARGDGDGKIRLFDLEMGTLRHTLPGHEEVAHGIAFSPDGRLLATTGQDGKHELFTGGNQNDLRFWSTQTGKLLAKSGSGRYTKPTFDPDGDTLITGDFGGELLTGDFGGELRLWDVRDLEPAAAQQ